MGKIEDYRSEIELLEKRNEYLAKDLRKYMQRCGPGDMRTDVSYLDADNIRGSGMDRDAVHQLECLNRKISEFNDNSRKLKELKARLESFNEGLLSNDNLRLKVKYLKNVGGYTLLEISEMLGYSYGYIRQVAMDRAEQEKI